MAELFTEDGTYRNVPVYDNFEYIADNKYDGWTTLSPVWTTSGLLIPISHSDTPAYMRIPRKECIKMLDDLLDLNVVRKILGSVNKKQNRFLEKVIDEKVTEHWVSATKDNVKVGSKVRMIDDKAHNENPRWFPVIGTVGVVRKLDNSNCDVQWPKGTTSWQDKWWCNYEYLEVLLCE